MQQGDYEFVGRMLKERSGLVLAPGKEYLLESRLMPIARERGLAGLDALIADLRRPDSDDLKAKVTEAMTTNESFFFRDKTPFDLFNEEMMPTLIQERRTQPSLRIWCSACSTGQEPYSLAMCLKDIADKILNWRIDIIGTDLSEEVLEKAKVGMYSQFEVQRGMPVTYLVKYFSQIGDMWQIDAALRAMVQYRTLNLLEPFGHLGKFDIVFCRNVLIYFDQPTKKQVLERIAQMLPPHGYLVLGAAETVLGITDALQPVPGKKGLYRPTAAASSQSPAPASILTARAS
jgi:chemotaxis protein methyltransferase CheR